MTATATRTGRQVAFDLAIGPNTFGRWCHAWHGPIGKGHPRHLTPVDQRVGRAWQALFGHVAHQHAAEIRRLVADAIRLCPERRWVAYDLTVGYAGTFDTPGDILAAWADEGLRCVGVVDLGTGPA